MSAQDNLNQVQFYHGSRFDFSPGDELTPGGARAVSGSTKRQIYFSDDPALASSFGHNVYRVTPSGDYSRKRRPPEKQEPGFPTEYEYSTRHPLKVEGRASSDEVWAARNARKEAFLKSPQGREWAQRHPEIAGGT